MFRVVLTCWDPGERPYADDLAGVKLSLFDSEYAARVAITDCVKQELVTLNRLEYPEPREKEPIEDSDGNVVGYDYPFREDDCGDHANIIRFWDGDDYQNVTAYDIYALHGNHKDLAQCSSYNYRGFLISVNDDRTRFSVEQFGATAFRCKSLQEALRDIDQFHCDLEHGTPSLQAQMTIAAFEAKEREMIAEIGRGRVLSDANRDCR